MEKKDLRAKIIALKKSSGKGAVSKDKKKEIQQEIDKLESQLKQIELSNETEKANTGTDEIEDNDSKSIGNPHNSFNQGPEPVRRKKKERKNKLVEQFEKKRKEALLEQENEPNYRELEKQKIDALIKPLSLRIHEIRPDGHCLYTSISHQLSLQKEVMDYKHLRKMCAEEISLNKADYLPFLVGEDGNELNDEQFQSYCDKIVNTAEWGGQFEIMALSKALKREIRIIQSDMPILEIGTEFKESEPLILSLSFVNLGITSMSTVLVNITTRWYHLKGIYR